MVLLLLLPGCGVGAGKGQRLANLWWCVVFVVHADPAVSLDEVDTGRQLIEAAKV
jgi:hypothetical protein